MAYLENFLTNNFYKYTSFVFGIFYVYFINFKDNTKNINFTNITEYNNSTNINICENILKSVYLYKLYCGIIISIILIYIIIFNFKLLFIRKYFCRFLNIIALSFIIIGIFLTLFQIRYHCFTISLKYYKYQQITYFINYITFIIMYIICIFGYLYNNYSRINYDNTYNIEQPDITIIDKDLPTYTEINLNNDLPPPYN